MDTDDLDPPRPVLEPVNLEVMSIEALEAYIGDLEAEIGRARDAIAGKRSARNDADAVFKF